MTTAPLLAAAAVLGVWTAASAQTNCRQHYDVTTGKIYYGCEPARAAPALPKPKEEVNPSIAMRELCGDLYGTSACGPKWANRLSLCKPVPEWVVMAQSEQRGGKPLREAEVFLSEAWGVPFTATEFVYRHPELAAGTFFWKCASGRDPF